MLRKLPKRLSIEKIYKNLAPGFGNQTLEPFPNPAAVGGTR